MFSLKGKTAVVTGSTGGIGRGILEIFGRAGANLVMNGRRPPDDLEQRLESFARDGVKARFIEGDMTDSGRRAALVSETIEAFGGFDILVNNAGSLFDGSWDQLDESTCRKTLDLNVTAMLMMAKLAIDHFRETGRRGSIVNVASVNSFMAEPNSVCYDISKGAILMMTRTLAVETFRDPINVNALCPGLIDTPLTRRLLSDEEKFNAVGAAVPKKRWGTIEECGFAALYLVSDEARYMTGQPLILDGGILAVQATVIGDLR